MRRSKAENESWSTQEAYLGLQVASSEQCSTRNGDLSSSISSQGTDDKFSFPDYYKGNKQGTTSVTLGLDELEEKAKILHKDVIDQTLAREKRALESKIGYANEKGRRFMLFGLLEERKLLQSPSHRLRLLSAPPKMIPEIQEPSKQLKELIGEKGSPKLVSADHHSPPGKSSSLDTENQQNPIPATSADNVDVDELLDQLTKPDISCSSTDSGSSDAVKDIKEGLILLLKQVPVSDFKSMISVTNGVFTGLRGLPINYIPFYECVRNYIRSCYLLASTEEFKQASSMEELAIKYDSCKEYAEMTHESMMKLSTEITESITVMQDQVSDVEKSLAKYENEHLIAETKYHSGSLRKASETLKRLQDSLRHDLEPLDNTKKQCYFEEIWEAFMNAKADLGL